MSKTLIIPSMAPLARYFPSGLCKVCNILNKEMKKIKITNQTTIFYDNNRNLFYIKFLRIYVHIKQIKRAAIVAKWLKAFQYIFLTVLSLVSIDLEKNRS